VGYTENGNKQPAEKSVIRLCSTGYGKMIFCGLTDVPEASGPNHSRKHVKSEVVFVVEG
jgi:hypothetical protein